MVDLLGRAGPATVNDGTDARFRLTGEGAIVTQQLHGQYYEAVLRGRVFSQAPTPLGLAIPIYTATAIAGAMPIWNPPNSGVNVVPLFCDLPYASGTADFGAIGVMARKLNAIATGEVCTAFAAVAPINGRALIGGYGSQVQSSNAGTVTVSAGVAGDFIRSLASINLEAVTGTAHGLLTAHYDFDGSLIIPPGVLVYLAATKASVALYVSTVAWEEVPV